MLWLFKWKLFVSSTINVFHHLRIWSLEFYLNSPFYNYSWKQGWSWPYNRELKQQRRRRLQKRHLKSFKLYGAYSISFSSSNFGKCFWSWILMDCIKVQEKKRKLLSCVPVLDKTRIQALSCCSRATTAKKCTKKAWCTCKVVVLLIKPIAFLPFSLPSASSLLKLPNVPTRPFLLDYENYIASMLQL